MAISPKKRHPKRDKSEEDVDKAVEDTFPGSDPPTTRETPRLESEDGETDEDSPD
jgi:hypothetical protein